MKFLIKEPQKIKAFSLVYNDDEYSFNIEPFEHGIDFTSITIGTLQLEIDNEGKVMYVWGYYPLKNWEKTRNFPEKYENKDLIVVLDQPLIPGVSVSLIKKTELLKSNQWPTYLNQEKGWICIGNPEIIRKKLIQFAPGCVAALDANNEMIAVWLHPLKFPKNI